MPIFLFLLFVVVPILEIATFIQVGSLIGLPLTLAGILFTAIVGAILVRQQGFKVLTDARLSAEKNTFPVEQIIHGVFILAAGLLLLTPGFLTDTIGFIFLVPPARLAIARFVWSRMKDTGSFEFVYEKREHYRDDNTIDGDAVDITEPPKKFPPS